MSTDKGPLLSAERILLIRQKYQAGQGRPENGDDGPYAYRAQGVQIGCEIAKEIYEADRKELLSLVQVLVDALNGSIWPNAISADELALLAMTNAGSQKQVDRAREIASDHRKSQEASQAALSLAKSKYGITPTTR